MFGLGFGEMLLLGFVAMLFFGPKRLPDLGSSMGKAIKNFKKGISETEDSPAIGTSPKVELPSHQETPQDQVQK